MYDDEYDPEKETVKEYVQRHLREAFWVELDKEFNRILYGDSANEGENMTDLIFLDTETTGLEANKHEIWEVALAVNEGPITTHILVHSLKTADPKALDLNGYFRRHPTGARSEGPMMDLELRSVLEGNTIVGANPHFDRMFMYFRWGLEPYHYRSIDIETMALTVFDWERPRGQRDVARELRELGFDIPEPDHTAAKDVEVLRKCYMALREIQRRRIRH